MNGSNWWSLPPLPQVETASRDSSLEASNRAWRLKLEPGIRNSSLEAATRAWSRKSRPQVETASRDRKSRRQAKTGSRASKLRLEPPRLNGKFGKKTKKKDFRVVFRPSGRGGWCLKKAASWTHFFIEKHIQHRCAPTTPIFFKTHFLKRGWWGTLH